MIVLRKRVPDVGSGDRKARLPTVARLTGGTTRRLIPAERSALRPGTSTVEVSGPGPGPSAPESSTLTTRLPSHPGFYYTWDEMTDKGLQLVVVPR